MDCNGKESLTRVKRLVRDCTEFLNVYRWIIDAYVSDFFTLGHWEKLPASWRDGLSQMEPPDLAFLCQRNSINPRKVLPLSLLAYRCCCHSYSLPRGKVDINDSAFKELFQFKIEGQNEHKDLQIKSDHYCGSVSTSTKQSGTTLYHNDTHTDDGIFRKDEASVISENKSNCISERNNPLIENRTEFKVLPHSGISEGQGQSSSQIKDGQYLPLKHCFRKHVKPKKQHEILQLGQVIHMLGKACSCSHIVDIGAGQGHLSRILNFGFGLKVTTVEAAGCHAPKAQKFDKDLKRDIDRSKTKLKRKIVDDTNVAVSEDSHMDSEDNIPLPDHVTCIIQPDTSVENFLQVVQSSFRKHLHDSDLKGSDRSFLFSDLQNSDISDHSKSLDSIKQILKGDNLEIDSDVDDKSNTKECNISTSECLVKSSVKFMMTGLHACGDLTSTMIRVYSKCPDIIGLASVSCCYMKLTCKRNESSTITCCGYPMSKYLQLLPDHHLSYEAREMACHFADSYSNRLKDNPPNLKLHCYRAALQYIVTKLDPDFQRGCIKLTVKNAETMEFKKYAVIGLHRLGIQAEILDSLLKEAESYLPLWKEVVIFYTIRLSLAPVVETLILLDRVLFLYEKGFTSSLVPIFDPELSPRNFVLLSRKN